MSKKLDERILEKLKNDVDSFPIGDFEDIQTLSDPPNYTACPNPWIADFIKERGKDYDSNEHYSKKLFSSDVAENKHQGIYNVISYHTKIPPKAIVRYILHYTNPGDLIYDGFCGTGMTGIASQICEDPEPDFEKIIESEMPGCEWGARSTILCDISPIATFISNNLNNPNINTKFETDATKILQTLDQECGWMYETRHSIDGKLQYDLELSGKKKPVMGKINYVVWSDVFVCPTCSKELIFWNIAVDEINAEVITEMSCNFCKSNLKKSDLEPVKITKFDPVLNKPIKQVKQVPVLINYNVNNKKQSGRYDKKPDQFDLDLIKKIDQFKIQQWYPTYPMMLKGDKWGDTWRSGVHSGITHVHHFYTKRSLILLSNLFSKIENNNSLKFWVFTIIQKLTKKNRFMLEYHGRALVGPLSGTHYVPNIQAERYIIKVLEEKLRKVALVFNKTSPKNTIVTTQASTRVPQIPDKSIDYIFTDPPFGQNIMYSELNFIHESWLKVLTNNKSEAIISDSQNKSLNDYQKLMESSFQENFRILKPGRWMTVVFHNSQNAVWISIQEALEKAGFVIADVRILDKKKWTPIQLSNPSGAVKQDLILSTYRPFGSIEGYFDKLKDSTEEGVWKFIDGHLNQLPVIIEHLNIVQIISERQKNYLYDRMIAFHVQRGLRVPISAPDFVDKLSQKYPERDGMYFLAEQIPEYDQKRAQTKSIEQTTIFLEDERSTILWLNEHLKTPQTYQDLQPKYLKAKPKKQKYETEIELLEILDQNFLKDDNNKWHIPDPSKYKDLVKLREKSLYRIFQTYVESKGKLKQFRLEAIRAGFKKNWSENNYKSIVDIAQRLPENILQEDGSLLMYYHNARNRL